MSTFPPTRILCPTDMSELSRVAVCCGLAWASQFGAKVFVLLARESTLPPRYFTPGQVPALTRQAEATEEEVRADLQAWVAAFGAPGVPVEAVVAPGSADRVILKAIEVVRPHLVVMGTHGRSGYRRWVMGSTTESVLREIPVPVLTVREGCRRLGTGEKEPMRLAIRSILWATDDPEPSEQNLQVIGDLARAVGSTIRLLHSQEAPEKLPRVPPWGRREAVRQLTDFVHAHAPDLSVRVVVTEGPAYQRILEASLEETDLIVVGGHRPGTAVPVFGHTAIRVMRHAPCPVLALPGQAG